MKKTKYVEMKERHQQLINDFPFAWAFSDEQFKEGMTKLGLDESDTDKVCSIGAGGFIRKENSKSMEELFSRIDKEKWNLINEDTTGTGFIFDMFVYELINHEYCYTYSYSSTIEALGITEKHLRENKNILNGLVSACEYVKGMDGGTN